MAGRPHRYPTTVVIVPPPGYKLLATHSNNKFYDSGVMYWGVKLRGEPPSSWECVRDGTSVLKPRRTAAHMTLTFVVVPTDSGDPPVAGDVVCDSATIPRLLLPGPATNVLQGLMLPVGSITKFDLERDVCNITLPAPLSPEALHELLRASTPRPPLAQAAHFEDVLADQNAWRSADLQHADAPSLADFDFGDDDSHYGEPGRPWTALTVPWRDTLSSGEFIAAFGRHNVREFLADEASVYCYGSLLVKTLQAFGTIGALRHALAACLDAGKDLDPATLTPERTRRVLRLQRDTAPATRYEVVVVPKVEGTLRVSAVSRAADVGECSVQITVALHQLPAIRVDSHGRRALIDVIAPRWFQVFESTYEAYLCDAEELGAGLRRLFVEGQFETGPTSFRDDGIALCAAWGAILSRMSPSVAKPLLGASTAKVGKVHAFVESENYLDGMTTLALSERIGQLHARLLEAQLGVFCPLPFRTKVGKRGVYLCLWLFFDSESSTNGTPITGLSNMVLVPKGQSDTADPPPFAEVEVVSDHHVVTEATASGTANVLLCTVGPLTSHEGHGPLKPITRFNNGAVTGANGANGVDLGSSPLAVTHAVELLGSIFVPPTPQSMKTWARRQLEAATAFMSAVIDGNIAMCKTGDWRALKRAYKHGQKDPSCRRPLPPPVESSMLCVLHCERTTQMDIAVVTDMEVIVPQIRAFKEGGPLPAFLAPIVCPEGQPCMRRAAVVGTLAHSVLGVQRELERGDGFKPKTGTHVVTIGELMAVAKIYSIRMRSNPSERAVAGMTLDEAVLSLTKSEALRMALVACDGPFARIRALLDHAVEAAECARATAQLLIAGRVHGRDYCRALLDVAEAVCTGHGDRLMIQERARVMVRTALVPMIHAEAYGELMDLLRTATVTATQLRAKCEDSVFFARAVRAVVEAIERGEPEQGVWPDGVGDKAKALFVDEFIDGRVRKRKWCSENQ